MSAREVRTLKVANRMEVPAAAAWAVTAVGA